MHTVKVKFLQDYQGVHAGPHFYQQEQEAELELAAAIALKAEGRVHFLVDEEEKPKRKGRKAAE